MIDVCSASKDELAMEMANENARLLNFLYACPVGLVEISADGTIDMMNPVAMQLLLELSKMPSMNLFDLTATHAPELRNLLESFTPSQGTVCEHHRISLRTGQGAPLGVEAVSCTVVKIGRERFVVSLSDISSQVRQERKLKEAETWFSSLLEGASDFGLASLDPSGQLTWVSDSLCKQLGYCEDELLGQRLDVLEATIYSAETFTVGEQLDAAAREGWHLSEDWHHRKDGSRGWYQRLIAPRHATATGADISGYTVVLREGQQRSVDACRLKKMLTRDHLTGTYNRMHFFELAERECVRKKRYHQHLSLVIADVDFFKKVNDSHGHPMGDEVLKHFAKVCASVLKPTDAIARIGGEEFALLMPTTDLNEATKFAERLRLAVSENPVEVDGKVVYVTASFGCAELGDQCDLAVLMAEADAALYEAKRAGRNRVVARQSPGAAHAWS